MICSKCNANVPEGYRFCVQCGTPANPTPATPQPPPGYQPGGYVPPPYQQGPPQGYPPPQPPPAYPPQGGYQPPSGPVGYQSGGGGFQCSIEPAGAFALAVVTLRPEQSVKAEAGAMVSMSANVDLQSQAQGGIMGVLKRAVVGESAFINTFTARGGPGEVTFAPPAPGDIVMLELANQSYFVQSGGYLASSPSIELDLKFGGAKSFFSGEGLFLMKLSGTGTLLISSFGAIRRKRLNPGERYIVDTGHIVAFETSVQYTIRKASQQGFFRSMVSGEGFVCEYTGPGEIFLQTRNLSAFAGALKAFFPTSGG